MNFINPSNEACDGLVTVASGSYSVTRKDSLILCSGQVTVVFPAPAEYTGAKLFIKSISSLQKVITLDFSTNGSTCDGQNSLTINGKYGGIEVICTGSAWYVRSTGNIIL